ncbi:MAG: glycosyltransferase family 39 protein [Actinobacteria bacterium]|nr:glycosyltransferase family 39 protein [Actinomycetota bacterium]
MTTARAGALRSRALRSRAADWERLFDRRGAVIVTVGALTLLSLLLRSMHLNSGFWIDEGISVGVAHHHWTSIPNVLRQDGSPPGYYMLLGLWIRVFGDSEAATHTLSLIFVIATIPLSYATGKSLHDRRTGLVCALLVAFTPYLTYYGQETRMYALEGFLSMFATLAYVNGVLRERRVWAAALVPTLALMVYAHNWGLFFCLALLAATLAYGRDHLRTFGVVTIGVAILYLPWIPTVLSQAKHTGAPWSTVPSFHELFTAAGTVLGGDAPLVAFVVTAAAGLVSSARRLERSLAAIVIVAVFSAWIVSQVSPAWTTRYFGVILGPAVVLAAAAIVRAGRLGAVALVAVLFLWWGYSVKDDKENARAITAEVAQYIHPGELVISTHPEQVPVLRYYLGSGLRWATTLGPVEDPQVFDWRDAVDRLTAAQPAPTLDSLLRTVPPGREFVVVAPVFRDYRAWKAPWTRLVWRRSRAWTRLLESNPRFHLEHHVVTDEIAVKHNYFKPVQAFVYRRLR